MSHSIENRYLGELRTHSTHLKSSDTIITDAPVDNNGKGNAFSPTDLVASALCSCMTTVMGICAEKNNFELPGSTAYVTKIMESHPRRISKIIIEINFDNNNRLLSTNIRFRLRVPRVDSLLSPLLLTIPLQLLAYHVALLKNCDIDKPRNLAKSVTVE